MDNYQSELYRSQLQNLDSYKNDNKLDYRVQFPQGEDFFIDGNKKHYNRTQHISQIQSQNLLSNPDDFFPQEFRQPYYPRNLQVDDIEGTKTNTLISKAVINKDTAQKYAENRKQTDSLDALANQLNEKQYKSRQFYFNENAQNEIQKKETNSKLYANDSYYTLPPYYSSTTANNNNNQLQGIAYENPPLTRPQAEQEEGWNENMVNQYEEYKKFQQQQKEQHLQQYQQMQEQQQQQEMKEKQMQQQQQQQQQSKQKQQFAYQKLRNQWQEGQNERFANFQHDKYFLNQHLDGTLMPRQKNYNPVIQSNNNTTTTKQGTSQEQQQQQQKWDRTQQKIEEGNNTNSNFQNYKQLISPKVQELAKQRLKSETSRLPMKVNQSVVFNSNNVVPLSLNPGLGSKSLAFNLVGNQIVVKDNYKKIRQPSSNIGLNIEHFAKFPGEIMLKTDLFRENQMAIKQDLNEEFKKTYQKIEHDQQQANNNTQNTQIQKYYDDLEAQMKKDQEYQEYVKSQYLNKNERQALLRTKYQQQQQKNEFGQKKMPCYQDQSNDFQMNSQPIQDKSDTITNQLNTEPNSIQQSNQQYLNTTQLQEGSQMKQLKEINSQNQIEIASQAQTIIEKQNQLKKRLEDTKKIEQQYQERQKKLLQMANSCPYQ